MVTIVNRRTSRGARRTVVAMPGLEVRNIVWGVRDLDAAVRFWSAALGYRLREEPDEDWAALISPDGTGPALALMLVGSDTRDHQRHHLDLRAEDPDAEIERLLALGASRVEWRYPEDADYTVLADPDGNTFCVVDPGGS